MPTPDPPPPPPGSAEHILAWPPRLTRAGLELAVRWCKGRERPGLAWSRQRVESRLSPADVDALDARRDRLFVAMAHLDAARAGPDRPFFTEVARAAEAALVAAAATPGHPDRSALAAPFAELEAVVAAAHADPARGEVMLALAPEWTGSAAELIDAAARI